MRLSTSPLKFQAACSCLAEECCKRHKQNNVTAIGAMVHSKVAKYRNDIAISGITHTMKLIEYQQRLQQFRCTLAFHYYPLFVLSHTSALSKKTLVSVAFMKIKTGVVREWTSGMCHHSVAITEWFPTETHFTFTLDTLRTEDILQSSGRQTLGHVTLRGLRGLLEVASCGGYYCANSICGKIPTDSNESDYDVYRIRISPTEQASRCVNCWWPADNRHIAN